ncbi:EamA family transporter, partial [Escherichia coli]|uniref:EamA family transporter n=1 Tax=Escherichia coli TaxID=562 RepID=UPI002157E69F
IENLLHPFKMVLNMLNNLKRAEFFALIAAIFNGSIGVFTRFGFNSGLTPNTLAFWKCFGAFLLLFIYCFANKQLRKQTLALKNSFYKFAILSFLGIFCLYFFETQAFNQASIH